MGDFIIGVVVNVLGHIAVQYRHRSRIGRIPASTRDFFIWNASEFVVLEPEIGLNDFSRRRKPKHGCVSPRQVTATVIIP